MQPSDFRNRATESWTCFYLAARAKENEIMKFLWDLWAFLFWLGAADVWLSELSCVARHHTSRPCKGRR